jgi:hypothetical protein
MNKVYLVWWKCPYHGDKHVEKVYLTKEDSLAYVENELLHGCTNREDYSLELINVG